MIDVIGTFNELYLNKDIRIYNSEYKDLLMNYFANLNNYNYDYVKDCVLKIIKKYLSEDICGLQEFDLESKINSYDNVFITSDLHLNHKKILLREPKRSVLLSGTLKAYKDEEEWLNCSSFEHDYKLCENYNNVVGKDDLCIILGDLSLGNGEETNFILEKLNGDKLLITGNHDNYLNDKRFNKNLFINIKDYYEFKYKNQNIVLCHYPILHFKRQEYEDGFVHLFGHTHTAEIYTPYHSYNVGVDKNDYKPIYLEKAIEYAKNERTNKTRYNNEGLKDGIFS